MVLVTRRHRLSAKLIRGQMMVRNFLIVFVVAFLVSACNKDAPLPAPTGEATATTIATNSEFGKSLKLTEQQGFDDAKRGLIANSVYGCLRLNRLALFARSL